MKESVSTSAPTSQFRRAFKKGLHACVAASALVLPTAVWAQEAGEAAPQGGAADIVVTANRREQRLQDVGLSITSLSDDALKNMNIVSAMDVAKAVPSLKVNATGSVYVVYNIRGVSQNDFGDQTEPPIAVYQDDSYASTVNLSSFPLFDLQRVEVDRGPQGTLFGRNATGGAVQFISKKPSKEFGGYGSIIYGSYNDLILEGALTGPITDSLQFRVAGQHHTADGYLKNIGGGPDNGGQNNWAVRGQLAWQPGPGTNVNLTTRYSRIDHEHSNAMYSVNATYLNEDGQGVFLPADMHNPISDVNFPGNTFGPGTDGTGYRNDAINYWRGGDPFTIATNTDSFVDRKIFGASLHIDQDIGNFVLTSVTDYQYLNKKFLDEGDISPVDLSNYYSTNKTNQITQELRATGRVGAHNLTAGAFYMHVDGDYTASVRIFPSYLPLAVFNIKTTSFAFFAQDEWTLTDKLKFTGGLRYWHDNRKLDYIVDDGLGGVYIINQKEISPLVSGLSPSDANKNYSGLSARAQLDYNITDDAMVYVSYNRGNKSGGFTLPGATPPPSAAETFMRGIFYKPETLNAYELGIKTTIAPSTTLNFDGFIYDYRDYQAFAIYNGLITTILNLDATVHGLELELNTQPVDGLTFQLGASYLDSTVKDVPLPSGRLVDHRLPQAPKFSGNAMIRYEMPVGPGKASVQLDGTYTGSFCFSVLCAPVERHGAYALLNGRIGFAADAGWDLSFFVNNITDKSYRIFATDLTALSGNSVQSFAKPRTWGIQATYHFGSDR